MSSSQLAEEMLNCLQQIEDIPLHTVENVFISKVLKLESENPEFTLMPCLLHPKHSVS